MTKDSDWEVILGANIRNKRKKAGYTQEELAERADLTPNYIGLLERGERQVSVEVLCRIAVALGVRVRDLCIGL